MSFIDTILSLLGRKKKAAIPSDFINQREMEHMADANSSGSDAGYMTHREMENLASINSQPQKGGPKYETASPSELTPLEGHPGQFTNGQGKGGHDPATGNSFGTYPVYDANGNFLGENATLTVRGQETDFGYSYGTPIPTNVDLSNPGMTQAEALQSAGLNVNSLSPPVIDHHNDNDNTSNTPMHSSGQGKGAVINGVPTSIPSGMVAVETGEIVMQPDTALKSAGLNIDSLEGWAPSKGGPEYDPKKADSTTGSQHFEEEAGIQDHRENQPMSGSDALRSAGLDFAHSGVQGSPADVASRAAANVMSQQEALQRAGLDFGGTGLQAAPAEIAAPARPSAPAGGTYIVGGEVITPPSTPNNDYAASRQKLNPGGMQKLDPDGGIYGGGAYDFAGQTENPVEGMGGDPTVGGGDAGSRTNYAV